MFLNIIIRVRQKDDILAHAPMCQLLFLLTHRVRTKRWVGPGLPTTYISYINLEHNTSAHCLYNNKHNYYFILKGFMLSQLWKCQ